MKSFKIFEHSYHLVYLRASLFHANNPKFMELFIEMVSRPFTIFSQDYAKSVLMCLTFLILTLIWTLLEDTKKITCS